MPLLCFSVCKNIQNKYFRVRYRFLGALGQILGPLLSFSIFSIRSRLMKTEKSKKWSKFKVQQLKLKLMRRRSQNGIILRYLDLLQFLSYRPRRVLNTHHFRSRSETFFGHKFLIYEGNIGLLVLKLLVSVSSITCNHLCYKYVSK